MTTPAFTPVCTAAATRRAALHLPVTEALRSGHRLLAATDEAGAGPLAGPVVAAAVLLLPGAPPPHIPHLDDSKRLTRRRRAAVRAALLASPQLRHAVCVLSPAEVDRLNVLQARLRAMEAAVAMLPATPDLLFVDGHLTLPASSVPVERQRAVKGGDALVSLIAAASVLAKERRDDIMRELHDQFPVYGFAQHKGYPTRLHLQRLKEYGPCREHRRSFRPVREALRDGCDPWESVS